MTTTAKKAPALKLIVGAAAIEKAILSIGTRGARLDSDIQMAGLSIISHVEAHGDTTLADRLYQTMPKGGRRLALAEWCMAFGKMRALKGDNPDDAEALKAGRVFQFDKTRKTDMLGAVAKPWYECKKEANVATVFDVQAEFGKFMARVAKAQASGLKIEHDEVLSKLLAVTQ